MAKKVTAIPATLNKITSAPIMETQIRRVCGYARVSTDQEEQATSYEAQLDYYENYIKAHRGWVYVGMYSDEGITGTSIKHREGFQEMIADALDGKIDLIITKSVSRFARNTVDSLQTVRTLKEHGVEIYFEKENIWTFDSKGELLITIMSSLAQEESRSISENTTWGRRKSFADGKVSVGFKNFLGYDRGPNGEFVVNEEQAQIVRLIYKWFLLGDSHYTIATRLTEMGIKSPGGKDRWHCSTVKQILKNEKYKGDALLQKEYTVDFLTKKKKKNRGEVPQYYVEGHHEAIVSKDDFDRAQLELARRTKYRGSTISYSAKIICCDCGSYYSPVVFHSNDQYRQVVYRCIHKYTNPVKCSTPNLKEERIHEIFVTAVNKVLFNKKELIQNAILMKKIATDTTEQEKARDLIIDELNALADSMQNSIIENSENALDQENYLSEYERLADEYGKKKAEYDSILDEIEKRKLRIGEFNAYIKNLSEAGDFIEEFDLTLWSQLIDHVEVRTKEDITVVFKDGTEIKA